MKGICSFLGETFEEKMLEYHNTGEAKKSGSLSIPWENTSKPVIADNKEKFIEKLSQKEIMLFEAIAFNELTSLGYKLINQKEKLEQVHDSLMKPRLSYWFTEKLLSLKVENNSPV